MVLSCNSLQQSLVSLRVGLQWPVSHQLHSQGREAGELQGEGEARSLTHSQVSEAQHGELLGEVDLDGGDPGVLLRPRSCLWRYWGHHPVLHLPPHQVFSRERLHWRWRAWTRLETPQLARSQMKASTLYTKNFSTWWMESYRNYSKAKERNKTVG